MKYKAMNSILHFLSLLLCIWIYSSYCHTDTPSEAPAFSLHHQPAINKIDDWKEIDLVYENRLPHSLNDIRKAITECVKAYNTAGKTLFKCKEHIRLLRPGKVIKHWLEEQRQTGYIHLTIKEFGLINTKAYILSVNPAFISQKCHLKLSSKLNKSNNSMELSCVTGIFKRHVNNVKSYTFKHSLTGKTETIHATPNHLFYVKNRKGFIALDEITSTDELLTSSGNKMRLLCPEGKRIQCGISWKKYNISVVYNLEVYKEHGYFTGNSKIYVHNMYFCPVCRKRYTVEKYLKSHIEKGHKGSTDTIQIKGLKEHLMQIDKKQSNEAAIMETHPYKCYKCHNAFFKNRRSFNRHEQSVHSAGIHAGFRVNAPASPFPLPSPLSLSAPPPFLPCTASIFGRQQPLHLDILEWKKTETEIIMTGLIEKEPVSEGNIPGRNLPEIQGKSFFEADSTLKEHLPKITAQGVGWLSTP